MNLRDVVVLSLSLTVLGPQPSPHPSSLFNVADVQLAEVSGISVSGDGARYHVTEDARGGDEVYVLDERGGTRATVAMPAGLNEDWEDIATVRGRIYLADLGDAWVVRQAAGQKPRASFRIVTLDEPPATAKGRITATGVVSYPVEYDDRIARNSEAMLVHPVTGQIYVISKAEKAPQKPVLWAAPPTLNATGVNKLTRLVADVGVLQASGAAFSPTGDRIVIRNATKAWVWRVKGNDVAGAFTSKPVEIALPVQRQGEGVSFTADGHALLVNSEGPKQPVWSVPLPAAADTATAPDPLPVSIRDTSRDLVMLVIAGSSGLVAVVLVLVYARRGRGRYT
ncbi:hypothetical protein ACFXJ8_32710 [Nonomuraea sp. NPDC059194]|uniref:hypothetical protein n=1 Tax=Nonomuraea sp. NPDC059194 TaxID=3346764 RepID=UPI00368E0515